MRQEDDAATVLALHRLLLQLWHALHKAVPCCSHARTHTHTPQCTCSMTPPLSTALTAPGQFAAVPPFCASAAAAGCQRRLARPVLLPVLPAPCPGAAVQPAQQRRQLSWACQGSAKGVRTARQKHVTHRPQVTQKFSTDKGFKASRLSNFHSMPPVS